MNLLSIDCACSILSIAAVHGEEIYCMETQAGAGHSEFIMDHIDKLMKKASMKAEDLDGVLCMGGPGSFTGLRIGFSIAKGLALSLSIPFWSFSTLDCMAFPYHSGSLTLAAVKAGKNTWFYSFYRGGKQLMPPSDADAVQIIQEINNFIEIKTEKMTLTGQGADSLYDSFPQELKENTILAYENRGYSTELISIAKKEDLLDNYDVELLYSGPQYIRGAGIKA